MSRLDEVVRRDGPACVWCGREAWARERTLEHLVPRSRGGRSDLDNLRIACRRCNRERGSQPLAAYARRARAPDLGELRDALTRLQGSAVRAHRDAAERELRHLASVGSAAELDRRELLRRAGGTMALFLPALPSLGAVPAVARARPRPALQTRRPSLRALRAAVRGPVLTPGSSRGIVYNERYADVRPLAVVRATGAGDVQAAVRWAADAGVRVTARSGGHSYAGYSTARGGLVVDLRGLDRIALSGASGTATVGPGAKLIDVYAKLAARGVTVPAGSCPTVGIGGLALGGGVGLASRKLGTTSDNLVSARIVTADGRLSTCDATTEPDLFWACRGGGGGNFGIVTALELDVTRVSRAAFFNLTWPWSQAEAAVAAWQHWAPETTDDLYSVCTLATGGASPTISAFGQLFGSTAQLRRLIGPLTATGSPSVTVGSAPYAQVLRRWAACSGESIARCGAFDPTPFFAKSMYVDRPLPARARATMTRWIERRQGRSGALLLDAYGGALNEPAPDATAFVHRDQLFSCQFLAYGADGPARRWIGGFYEAMNGFGSGEAYQNYIDPDLRGWPRAYYGANLPRLREVKAAYDPGDLFGFRQGISPAG